MLLYKWKRLQKNIKVNIVYYTGAPSQQQKMPVLIKISTGVVKIINFKEEIILVAQNTIWRYGKYRQVIIISHRSIMVLTFLSVFLKDKERLCIFY